ncbi:hypothetical protein [Desulforhopalus sp. 52FAK]
MKYLPSITVLLWISILIAYIFANGLFIQPMIIYPSLILLSIFLTVSFWTLQAEGKKLYSLVFIGIFCFNNTILAYAFVQNHSTLNSLLEHTGNKIDPDFAKLLVSGKSEKERSAVGHIVFQKYGVALPFMTHDGLFSLHTPTKADKRIFMRNNEKSYLLTLKKQNLSNQIITTFFLLSIQVMIFSFLLIYLILNDRPPQPVIKET